MKTILLLATVLIVLFVIGNENRKNHELELEQQAEARKSFFQKQSTKSKSNDH